MAVSPIGRQPFGAGAVANGIPVTGDPDHAGDIPQRTGDLAQAKPGERRWSPHWTSRAYAMEATKAVPHRYGFPRGAAPGRASFYHSYF